MTVLRADAHESRAQERLVVTYRVNRRHDGINLAVIGEDAHLSLRPERLHDLFLGRSCGLHQTITLTLANGTHQNLVHLLLRKIARIRCILLTAILLVECRLQILDHMFLHSLLGIRLHPGIDGGMHFQTIGIDIIRVAIFLVVLVTPAIQWILLPVQ